MTPTRLWARPALRDSRRGGRRRAEQSPLLDGLVAYWPFNEAGGANDVLDLHGSKTFTQSGSPGASTGLIYTTARTFDKTVPQYAYRANDPEIGGGSDFTFGVWFYLHSYPGGTPNYYYLADCGYGWTGWSMLLVNNGNVQCYAGVTGTGEGYGVHVPDYGWSCQLNTWYYALMWYQHSSKTVWAEMAGHGPLSVTGSVAMNTASNYHTFACNRARTGMWLDGRLQGACFWNRLLTADERALWLNSGSGLAYPFS